MHLNHFTTGQLERLQLLGCTVVIRDGEPQATVTGLAVARVNSITHALRVRSLRRYWKYMRDFDRQMDRGADGFWETYMVTRYKARQVLPARWFNRA